MTKTEALSILKNHKSDFAARYGENGCQALFRSFGENGCCEMGVRHSFM